MIAFKKLSVQSFELPDFSNLCKGAPSCSQWKQPREITITKSHSKGNPSISSETLEAYFGYFSFMLQVRAHQSKLLKANKKYCASNGLVSKNPRHEDILSHPNILPWCSPSQLLAVAVIAIALLVFLEVTL